jgi:hypothetical protein
MHIQLSNKSVAIAISGRFIAYELAILVARKLRMTPFEAYVMAQQLFMFLATPAPFAIKKRVLRQYPALKPGTR